MNNLSLSQINTPLPPNFEDMEVEAKFVIPDLQTYEILKALQGQRLEEYRILFRYEAMFIDTYYDTEDLDIFHKDGALRARRRYRDPQASIPRDARFQAKDDTTVIDAVFFRNETRGKRSREPENWDSFLEMQLKQDSQDNAINFIREFAELNNKSLSPVLKVLDVRYRLFLSKEYQLLYEMSLDRLQFIGLTGIKGSQNVYECEIESISEKTDENIKQLISVSNKIADQFQLIPSPASKYRRGIKSVVIYEN
ncbi:CYTH domain-containing protein [Acaryochloris marina]|uniref:CYTH domain-containing protein n=1 Tax=Acaryochloris marina TaxID=155978 RepID=UPI0021C4C78D|nr:CYTH domain-containing protein [Acaryochloris marina]BDM83813.1 hypothetical protein AM10699_66740 [Acaryochloris marina MBIC10699]